MSAVAGVWDRSAGQSRETLAGVADAMANTLRDRGPDGGELWCDAGAGIALAHRQHALTDRWPAARQPLISSCGRFVLSCDGEVYNASELIPELRAAGREFPGLSDMEVIVEGAAAWGIETTARRLNATFAAALWDRELRVLHLFRDRLGMRPLYWAHSGNLFLFGSELKALRACASFEAELDRDVVVAFLRRRCVPGPYTIYRGARMLELGAILSLKADGDHVIRRYWSLEETARSGQQNRFDGSEAEAAQRLDELLRDAVARRIGNAPIGTFLSGGIDSSTMLALLQAVGTKPAQSFSVGFQEREFNEADHAGAVARHLGAEHSALYVSPEHAGELIPRLPEMYDEPMADVSQIPTYFLAKLARQHVPVAFTGDGGDELFGGYERYLQATDLLRHIRRLPLPARRAAKATIRLMPAIFWTRLSVALPTALRPPHFGDKLHMLARILTGDADDIYRLIVSYWQDPETMVPGGHEPPGLPRDPRVKSFIPDHVERMQYFDTLTILPDGALTKVDRAASAAALHIRMPFLDPSLVDFSWTLPPGMKLRGRTNKWLLRQVLYRYVPPQILERPKMGFDVPIGAWLRGPLRDWAEDLLGEARLKAEGIFDPQAIRAKWQEHLDERRNWQGALWVVLMFQAWKQRWLPRA
jgi:asparagine synthase (glutamine-hydrolysing)